MNIVQNVRRATVHLFDDANDTDSEGDLDTLHRCCDILKALQVGEVPSPQALSSTLQGLRSLASRERQALSTLNAVDTLKQLDRTRPGDAYVLQMLTGVRMQTRLGLTPHYATTSLKRQQDSKVLGAITGFQFDSFALDARTNHKPLSSLAMHIFDSEELFEQLNLDRSRFLLFVTKVQDGYRDVPYHNRIHAADVLQRVYAILRTVSADIFTLEEKFACYMAAMVHDYGHTGVTASFLVSTRHAVARRYNDRSPWENYHVASALELVHETSSNFMCNMTNEQTAALRQDIVMLVKATDMAKHMKWMKRFVECTPLSRSLTHNGKILALSLALKAADIGHTTCDKQVHLKWVAALQEEMHAQGDVEKELGMSVEPMRDRNSGISVGLSQLKFFDIIVIPLLKALTVCFTATPPLLHAAQRNRNLNR